MHNNVQRMTDFPAKGVFIADDDEDDRILLQYAFAQHSPECHLVFAEDGVALLETLTLGHFDPCLIILDMNMPRLNGMEALQLLRRNPAFLHKPIVILTTSNDPADRQLAFTLGANEFLTKPLSLVLLEQMVMHLRSEWRLDKCI
ncbi:response regulator [Spirosoma aerophilum]